LIRAGLDGADVTLIDSLTAQKRLAQGGFGLALVPESSVRDELRQGALVAHELHGQMDKVTGQPEEIIRRCSALGITCALFGATRWQHHRKARKDGTCARKPP
jgi:DNA-binding transcriptional LysR family regulator